MIWSLTVDAESAAFRAQGLEHLPDEILTITPLCLLAMLGRAKWVISEAADMLLLICHSSFSDMAWKSRGISSAKFRQFTTNPMSLSLIASLIGLQVMALWLKSASTRTASIPCMSEMVLAVSFRLVMSVATRMTHTPCLASSSAYALAIASDAPVWNRRKGVRQVCQIV